jgi:nucleoid DNA-binding protein
MSVKEWIIKKMSINMVISEKTIDAVVTHQFDSANDALNVNKSVEISGFGKFYFNNKKAITQYNKLLNIKRTYENALADENITDTKRNALELKMQIVESSIKTLKPKIDEPGTNL